MRDLKRNHRTLWYASRTGIEKVTDEYGNETLEELVVYSTPTKLRCNVSANAGQEATEVFGAQTEYSRTLIFSGRDCPLHESDRVWFGVEPNNEADNNNYTVARVADSKNSYLVALREVSKRG